MSAAPIQPVHLVLDTSGSTLRTGLNAVLDAALPVVAAELAQSTDLRFAMSVVGFGTEATLLVGLVDAGSVAFPSRIAAGGFSSLAAGLRLLGEVMVADAAQTAADGVDALRSLVVVLTDGLPTDSDDALRDAYREWAGRTVGVVAEVLVVLVGEVVARSVAGLGEGRVAPDVRTVALPDVEVSALVSLLVGWLGRDRVSGRA